MTKKFNSVIEELNRRGLLKGLGGALGLQAGKAIGVENKSDLTKDNFISRVETLVSYLETGIKPKLNSSVDRKTALPDGIALIRRFGDAYDVAYGGKRMGRSINSKPYPELNQSYFGAKGKYQIIPSTFNDLVKKRIIRKSS